MISKKFIFLFALVVIILVALTAWITISLGKENPNALSPYSAVYLSTGDIYFGKLSSFPKSKLENAWLVQRSVNAESEPELSVVPFSGAFWGPSDTIYLNAAEIVFSTRLRKDSPVALYLSNPSAANAPASSDINTVLPPENLVP